ELLAGMRAAGRDRGLVGDAGRALLGGEVGTDVAHVLRAQRGSHRGHDRALALAGLEQVQLARDVALVLAGEARVLRVGGVAIGAVAGGAGAGLGLAGLGIAPGGRLFVGERGDRGRGRIGGLHGGGLHGGGRGLGAGAGHGRVGNGGACRGGSSRRGRGRGRRGRRGRRRGLAGHRGTHQQCRGYTQDARVLHGPLRKYGEMARKPRRDSGRLSQSGPEPVNEAVGRRAASRNMAGCPTSSPRPPTNWPRTCPSSFPPIPPARSPSPAAPTPASPVRSTRCATSTAWPRPPRRPGAPSSWCISRWRRSFTWSTCRVTATPKCRWTCARTGRNSSTSTSRPGNRSRDWWW